ncbi:peptidoglycan-binding protein [Thiocapsa sp.]|uniref:peptidoglycan-binding protein n=1 Tax=Thiocapsa sp. TaxID=2024551 RepID=UPI002CC298DC|nr:peptidoglycan-binding protein [Thiocapsa sp.]HSO83620.1 peptidoglycan-binding protein [Thiocapsa sp.]
MSTLKRSGFMRDLVGVAACALTSLSAAAWSAAAELGEESTSAASVTDAVYTTDGSKHELMLAAYRDWSATRWRDYDRIQDISPRQMLVLLEVAERTGANLGQALATGEMESAHTWNDHVRPTIAEGRLGSATGVWQFIPSTFHHIIKKYGVELLATTEAAADREPMDLGEGPFSDAQVRRLIRDTIEGVRDAKDEELQLLRHNFAVLAFAKHYLSLDTGATTPEEDYLFHFLGAGEGRRILALARGAARDTLCVKPVEEPTSPLQDWPGGAASGTDIASLQTDIARDPERWAAADSSLDSVGNRSEPLGLRRPDRLSGSLQQRADVMIRARRPSEDVAVSRPALMDAAYAPAPDAASAFAAPPAVSSQWGLPADSPTVTGNLGMFYRDGRGQTQPFTWGEFMDHLARRVRAESQPSMVRAKYGVGFALTGGDMPEWVFDPTKPVEPANFSHGPQQRVTVPAALVTGPLDRDETRHYKALLAELVGRGEDIPMQTLPPSAAAALRHLGFLPATASGKDTHDPAVQKALRDFREAVGKAEPDDPDHRYRLMPAERVALAMYDRRIARYAALQTGQEVSLADAPDLSRIKTLPSGLQRLAAPHLVQLQTALAERELLKQPTRKSVWRDKKKKKRVSYKTMPFAGEVDTATLAALDAFQWRNGLRKTGGALDAATLGLLGLPPMGAEIFRPLSGPMCSVKLWAGRPPICGIRRDMQGPADVLRIAGLADLDPEPRFAGLFEGPAHVR